MTEYDNEGSPMSDDASMGKVNLDELRERFFDLEGERGHWKALAAKRSCVIVELIGERDEQKARAEKAEEERDDYKALATAWAGESPEEMEDEFAKVSDIANFWKESNDKWMARAKKAEKDSVFWEGASKRCNKSASHWMGEFDEQRARAEKAEKELASWKFRAEKAEAELDDCIGKYDEWKARAKKAEKDCGYWQLQAEELQKQRDTWRGLADRAEKELKARPKPPGNSYWEGLAERRHLELIHLKADIQELLD